MKKYLFLSLIIAVIPVKSFAQSDYAVTWDIKGLGGLSGLELDVNVESRYLSAHGALLLEDNSVIAFSTR